MSLSASASAQSATPATRAAAREVAVPLLDLKPQYAAIRAEVEPILREVCESQQFIGGPKVEALEREIATYCRAAHAVGCANGSDAILLALRALGIEAGDAVICPTFTFFATAGSIDRLGARPVFVDIDPASYNIAADSVREALHHHPNVKAIMPVHLFGQACDLDAILEIAHEHGAAVVEDAAQAIGAEDAHGARVGSRGDLGTFSFFPSKNLGGFGDGGMITTNEPRLDERLRRLRNHGMEPKYYHGEVGMNSRLDALQAAILSVKLRHLDAWTAARQRNAARYDERFREAGASTSAVPLGDGGFPLRTPQPAPAGARHIYNQYVIRVPAPIRDRVRDGLASRKIGTEIYYPVPLHLQACFAALGQGEGTFPHSELAAREAIALPIHSDLSDEQLEWVAASVIDVVRSLA